MFKKILLSLGTIAAIGGIAVMGTQALLSDEVTLTANTFSTGSVDLRISVGSGWGETQEGFTVTGMLPGDTSQHELWLQNNNSGADLEISAQATNRTGTLSRHDILIRFIAVESDNTPISGGTDIAKTLAEWGTPSPFESPNIASGGMQKYLMEV